MTSQNEAFWVSISDNKRITGMCNKLEQMGIFQYGYQLKEISFIIPNIKNISYFMEILNAIVIFSSVPVYLNVNLQKSKNGLFPVYLKYQIFNTDDLRYKDSFFL